ncbi:MAG: two-component system response regulator [Rhodocyclales bacterium GWA2_65_20]|nr:MAG: two-component system response regulator [Rhodocyclales bacterium GWA2_65_20]
MSDTVERPLTLLFVDDEAGILSSLRRLFRPHGYRILTAESGAEGLEVLGKEEVDLVVSDMRMPNMDGAQFLKQVRARWPQVVRLLLTGYADISSTIAAINQGEIYRYISKPWDDEEIVSTIKDALERKRLERENVRLAELTQRQNEELKELNAGLEQKVAARTAEVQQTLAFLEQAHKELKRGFMATVRVFSGLIELRGGKLAGHARRVAEHARGLAQRLGLDDAAAQDVLMAALLHDIGKIGLSDAVLDRPFNSLPADVRGEVMKHPVTGQMVILGVAQLKGAALLIRHHHENFDGSGFPDRLVGLAIPLGARILTVANDYDALQMGLLVNRPLKPAEALSFIVENRGKRYDPQVANVFAAMLGETLKDEVIEVPLRPGAAKPGMVLTRDLMHKDGYLLLAKGQTLDTNVLEQLVRMESIEGRLLTLYIKQEAK